MTDSETVVVENPRSGSGDHATAVREWADGNGYRHERTHAAGAAITLAAEAAAGASTVVAAGGDGTVNEVVQGLDRADALGEVTLAVLPLGTGNNFATQIGVPDLETAFDVVETGARRRIDLGRANGRTFVNSCIAGLIATASSQTTPEQKSRFGGLAYVITTLRSLSEYDSPRLSIHGERDRASTEWAGDAILVLVGNGRRFSLEGTSQADMEDGRFEVAVVENVSTLDLVSDAIAEGLFEQDSADLLRFESPALTISHHDPESLRFSLDGEIVQHRELSLAVDPGALSVAVGEAYAPDPH